MHEYEQELKNLGIELKDYYTGLIDFPCWMDGREVYLCWRLGEPEVAYWHELEAGFAGRQKLHGRTAKPKSGEPTSRARFGATGCSRVRTQRPRQRLTIHDRTGRLSAVVPGGRRRLHLRPPDARAS